MQQNARSCPHVWLVLDMPCPSSRPSPCPLLLRSPRQSCINTHPITAQLFTTMYYTVITLPSFSFVPEQFSYKKLKKLGHMEQDKKKHMPWPADLCKGGLEGSISFKTQTKKKKKKKKTTHRFSCCTTTPSTTKPVSTPAASSPSS